jgi:hypothetical protein
MLLIGPKVRAGHRDRQGGRPSAAFNVAKDARLTRKRYEIGPKHSKIKRHSWVEAQNNMLSFNFYH